ncbi:type IVB secretion system protein IcmH/DotU [Paraburkholderia susongensis]|uniref:Type VI secretion system protein ImpK n=1 Tax=Paraburkholderia susongensis TaxID=1515439 RepID=A0A1X7M6L1_9BURK|nr:type IVB secretion system protein IcmH/DotU [Paraburkholderia susongensis]SMG61112.1 type VI secretion system protein ImpK [Paraburkholderia susongensis]
MNFLNDVAAMLRRMPGMQNTPGINADWRRLPGMSAGSEAASVADSLFSPFANTTTQSTHGDTAHNASEAAERTALAPARESQTPLQPAGTVRLGTARIAPPVTRAGRSEARWNNPIINAAMPVLLRLHRGNDDAQWIDANSRSQLALELKLFRERLIKEGQPSAVVDDASYLLCTYLDETANDSARLRHSTPYDGQRSLLVEFHGDSWGGEDAFSDLQNWMTKTPLPVPLLELYELVLSLGWQGRYRVLDRGPVLLADLRSQLNTLLWGEKTPSPLGAALPVSQQDAKRGWWTATRLCLLVLVALLLLYGLAVIDLDSRGRPVRAALAAWEPPMHTIDLEKNLPDAIEVITREGWMSAQRYKDGWRLTFRSDRAFNAGDAQFLPSFEPLIKRFADAIAPWPGNIEVVGHTDAQPVHTSRFPSNLALSEQRARIVAETLIRNADTSVNRPARRITWSGRGSSEPIDPANTPQAYERNRRVEILWNVVGLRNQSLRADQP